MEMCKKNVFSFLFIVSFMKSGDYQWKYQLQNYNMKQLNGLSNTLLVIDYSKDGTDSRRFTDVEIQRLRSKNNLVLFYLSIGEAEEYRYYFATLDKKLLVGRNKEWPDNHLVRYWTDDWFRIIVGGEGKVKSKGQSYLDRIIKAGVDGVYLDKVDSFDSFPGPKTRRVRARQMAELIKALSKYAKEKNPSFKIVLQNGIHIINYLEDKEREVERFLNTIDGIAMESVLFPGPKRSNNPFNPIQEVLSALKVYQKHGRPALSIEYLDQQEKNKIEQYLKVATELNIRPLVRNKALDRL